VAVSAVTATVNAVEVAGILNPVTVGGVASGEPIVTEALMVGEGETTET
jgi:hypothetical protein